MFASLHFLFETSHRRRKIENGGSPSERVICQTSNVTRLCVVSVSRHKIDKWDALGLTLSHQNERLKPEASEGPHEEQKTTLKYANV